MPAPGAQHTRSVANPFEEVTPHITEYTAQQVATLQARLEKQLGPEYLSARIGPSGQKVHYVAAEKCIALANDVFGFNGWSSSIQNIQVDFVDENPQTLKVSLGLSVIVRVTLKDGTYHEDVGYGHIENCKGKAAAFEKAKKEGTTDGLKRALRTFGNVLGNCIYDKEYLGRVTKMKVGPAKFDPNSLYRHRDYVVKMEEKVPETKSEPTDENHLAGVSSDQLDDLLGDIDEADFCVMEDGHPDEVALPEQGNSSSNSSNERTRTDTPATGNQTPQNMQRSARALGRSSSGGAVQANGPSGRPPQTPAQGPNVPQRQVQQATGNYVNRPSSGPQQGRPLQGPGTSSSMNSNGQQPRSVSSVGPSAATATSGSGATAGAATSAAANARTDGNAVAAMPAAAGGDTLPTAFFSAKSIKSLPEEALKETNGLAAAAGAGVPVSLFNPKLESPSIRKTPGFDHNSTKPIVKSDVLAASQAIANGGTGDQTAIRSATGTGGPAQPQPQQPQARHAAVSSAMAGRSAPPQHLPQHHQQVGAASGANQSLPRPTISGSGGSSLASNVLNPALDSARRVGAPGMGPASPLANRGTFRAPTMKRPLNSDGGGPVSGGGVAVGSTGGVAAVRTPLADVSNLDGSGAVATVDGGDLKRLKADHR